MSTHFSDLDKNVVDQMWTFFLMGNQEPNVDALKENVKTLIDAATQKYGKYEHGKKVTEQGVEYVDWNDLDMVLWTIVFEATALVLSGKI